MVIIGNGGIATEMVNKLDNVQIVWAIKDTSVNSVFSYPGAGEFFIKELHKDKVETDKPVKRMKYIVRGEDRPEFQGSALGPDWHRGFNTRGCCEGGKKTHLEYEVEGKQIISKELFNGSNLLQDKLEKFEEKDVDVELTNGKVLGCDFVVFAT